MNILIVDDDRAICDFMQTFLEHDGHHVRTMTDAMAVEAEVKAGNYHLIVLDLMMPKLDGIEVLKKIRKIDSDVAVVIFTGYPNLETAIASMQLSAIDYLKKPFLADEFRALIHRVMLQKGMLRNPEEALHKSIGDKIRQLRKTKDLTLKQLARRTSLSVSLISQIERAESSPSIATLFKIATALDCRMREFFGDY